MCERNTDELPLAHSAIRDQACNLGICPEPGIKLATLCFMGQCSGN